MKKLFTRDDLLSDFLEYIESVDEQCQEAKDWYHAEFPPTTTLGEAIDWCTANPEFIGTWAAYCYLAFPDMVDSQAYAGFEAMVDAKPEALEVLAETPKHRRKELAIKPKDVYKVKDKNKKVN